MAQNGETKQELSDVLDVNLYSRQIYALGQTAMFRLRSANILVSGIGSVGVEVAKNLVLGGVRHVTLHDTKNVSWNDLSAHYYLHEEDIGKNRADACFSKIEELNDSVTCSLSTEPLTHDLIKKFNVIVLTGYSFEEQKKINKLARESAILFISADIAGLFGYVFADLGDAFRIDDVDGEPPKEVWLEHINTTNGDVSTLDGALHGLETGDYVQFDEVKGCTELNGHEPIKITVKSKSVFNIGDVAANYGEYTEGGRAKQVKVPFEVKYKSLEVSLDDPTFLEWDFMKFESPSHLHQLFKALYKYVHEHGSRPKPFTTVDMEGFVRHLGTDIPEEFLKIFAFTSSGNLLPLASIVGGITAQEAMKAITHHTTPLNGFLYIDNVEALPSAIQKDLKNVNEANFQPRQNRYDGQAAVFGWDFVKEVQKCSPFIVGAGAIGCELLKNYAMMGIGTAEGSKIKITDMDQIEVSNLNRQFLFRKNDVGKKKSECAAEAVKSFNPKMNILALSERVAEDTEAIFNDDYFNDVDCVTNALDNIDARSYMDRRCVYYHLPLLESGTMGTKGNTQVIYPRETESYASSNDPPENYIPVDGLTFFPYEIQHTIEWARENNNNNNNKKFGTNETLSEMDERMVHGCHHRHSYEDGPHLARELYDGGYSFANGDCQLIGKDGKMIYINRLHAAAMSQFLSIALLNTSFSESGTKQIKFPLFTSTEILDALEMSNWVLYHWIEHHTIPPLSQVSLSCAFNILRVASFFNLEHLIQSVSLQIETQVEADKLIEAFRLAEVTDAKLCERLWKRILAEFALLFENNTFIYLTPSELNQCFSDSKFNIRVTKDTEILKKYRRMNVPGASPLENYVRKKEIERIFGREVEGQQQQFGALGSSQNHKRIPHEVIVAHAGWGENGPTSKIEIYDYHSEKWITPKMADVEESPRAYHGIAVIDKGILCMGGFNGRTYFRSTAFYDYENMHWNSVCAMVEPRCYVSLAKVDGSNIIACGGYTGQNRLRTTEIYNLNDNQWLKAGTMNFVRSDARAISNPEKNRVYMVGGFDGRQCHRTLEYYSAERDQWILEKGLMNSRRSGVGAVAIDANVIVAVGGFNGTHRLLSSEYYDIREGIWHQLADMTLSRSNFGNACLEGDPWVIGGYNADRTIADCERLDIKCNKWIPMPAMNCSRSAVACCIVKNVDWIEKIFETDSPLSNS